MNGPVFEATALAFAYPGGAPILHAVTFALQAGERVALVGANGAGKSTLLHLLVGLHLPTAGTLRFAGTRRQTEAEFRAVRLRAGLLFDNPDDQLICPTVAEDIAFGPQNQGLAPAPVQARVDDALEALGLAALRDRPVHRLSRGEKRLVALAGLLAMQPEALLLDEPTEGLDEAGRERLEQALDAFPGVILAATHDLRFRDRCARRLLLRDGRIAPA